MSSTDTPDPIDIIHITIVEGRNLPAGDSNGFSDPYVIIEKAHLYKIPPTKRRKTEIIKKTLNPVWNEQFTLKFDWQLTKLVFTVMDWDAIGSNDYLGTVKIPIDTILNNEIDGWFPLKHKDTDQATSGEIHLQISVEITKIALLGREVPFSVKEPWFDLKMGWTSINKQQTDLDASLIVLDKDQNYIESITCDIKYAADQPIYHSGDLKSHLGKGVERIAFRPKEIHPKAYFFVAVLHCKSGKNLSCIKSAYMRISEEFPHRTHVFSRTSQMEPTTALVFGFLLRQNNLTDWRFHCIQRFVTGDSLQQIRAAIVA